MKRILKLTIEVNEYHYLPEIKDFVENEVTLKFQTNNLLPGIPRHFEEFEGDFNVLEASIGYAKE